MLGITQGQLSKLENGQVAVSGEVLSALSKALDYPERHFYRPDEYRHLPFTYRRKRIKLTMTLERSIAAKVNLLRMYIQDLVRSVDMPEPRFSPINRKELGKTPREIALGMRMLWNVPSGPVQNLTKLLEDAGVLILQWDFGTSKVDGLSVYDVGEAPPLILINRSSPGDRQRFTLAHEFCHVLLHHNLQTLPPDDIEEEANEFASEFLMPAGDVRSHFAARPTLQTFANLKPHWRVSMAALIERAYSLNRISDWQHKSLWMQMGSNGYRTREPIQIPPERPSLIEELVQFHVRELGYTLPQLCEGVLGINADEFQAQLFGGLRVIRSSRATSP